MKRLWLIEKRKEKDLTQFDVACCVGVSLSTISSIELGRRNPSGMVAKRIADELGFDMGLFFKEEQKSA